jgi:hypothetical protein
MAQSYATSNKYHHPNTKGPLIIVPGNNGIDDQLSDLTIVWVLMVVIKFMKCVSGSLSGNMIHVSE